MQAQNDDDVGSEAAQGRAAGVQF
eukprot:COSAG05_NODE_10752_length_548_cov_0.910913_2_plen_23_part_01